MSVINEALKKAQKEKETRDSDIAWALASGGRKGNIQPGRLAFLSLILIAAVIILFRQYSFLNQRSDELAALSQPVMPDAGKEEKATSEMFYERARQSHKAGNIAEARELYLRCLELDPGYTDALNNLGVISIHEKEYSAARRYLEKAALLRPEHAAPYYNLACLFSICGEAGEGIKYLKKAVSLDQTVRGWARKDTDLKTLREVSEFEKIVEGDFNELEIN